MEKEKDHAGVYFAPPLIFVGFYLITLFLQKVLPIKTTLMEKDATKLAGIMFFLLALWLGLRGVSNFITSGTTILTMKPSSGLQQQGIYRFTRNPMYLGLICGYLGFTCFFGNWWHIIFLPVLILVIQEYVVKREERYLHRKFGEDYQNYRKKVRRWL